MADGEQRQLVQSQEGSEQKSYGTEATGVRGEEDEPKLLKEEPPENGLNQNIKPEEGSKSLTAAETDNNTAQPSLGAKDGEQEGSAIDPAKTASDHNAEEETVVEIETQAGNGGAVSDEAAATATKDGANLDKEIDQDRRPEQSPKEESGKTPPPEKPEPEPEVVKEELQSPKEENGKAEEPEMVKEGLQSPKEESGKPPPPGEPELEVHVIKEEPQGRSQTPPPPAEKAAPKQKEGGGGGLGFFSQLRRGFSTGPKRGKKREVTIIHLFCYTTHTYQIASTMKVFHWRRRERSTHVAGTSSLWTRLKRGKSLERSDVSLSRCYIVYV